MKNKLGGKILAKFVELIAKTYMYFIDDGGEDKEAKNTRKCVIKKQLKFENYQNSLEKTQFFNKRKSLEKNEINIDNLKIKSQKIHKKQ